MKLQDFRAHVISVQSQIQKLLTQLDPSIGTPLTVDRKNLLIRPGIAIPSNPQENYPDQINIKLYPGDITFLDTSGYPLDLTNIDLRQYDVDVSAQLRDIYKVGAVYYPRFLLTSCKVHPRIPAAEAFDSGDDSDDMTDDGELIDEGDMSSK